MSCNGLIRIGVIIFVVVILGFLKPPSAFAANPIQSFAIIQDDGTLKVRGWTIRLFGTHIPRTSLKSVVRALDRAIRGFVTCHPQRQYRNRNVSAICYVEQRSIADPPLDLGAWLIEQGLAVAGREAPFEYVALEDIARARGRGIWRPRNH